VSGQEVKDLSFKLSSSQKQSMTPRDNLIIKSKFVVDTASNDTFIKSEPGSNHNMSNQLHELKNSISSPIQNILKSAYNKF